MDTVEIPPVCPWASSSGIAHYGNRTWPAWIDESNDGVMVPIVRSASDVNVVVAGGDGRHSAWMAGWGVTLMSTERIEETPVC